MELDLVQQRQQAHLLLDVLPEEKLFAVHNLLEVLVEPLNRASASLDRGEGVSHKEMLREFGL